MARMAGADARNDLLDVMRTCERRVTTEGALYGLGELGDRSVVPEILNLDLDLDLDRARPRPTTTRVRSPSRAGEAVEAVAAVDVRAQRRRRGGGATP